MKRIHLFEFEDLSWFPDSLRIMMTRYVAAVHKVMGTSETVADIIAKALRSSKKNRIIDLCSGSGGPMLEVKSILKEKHDFKNLSLSLSDLYPNLDAAKTIDQQGDPSINYITESTDAANIHDQDGLRTMLCSLHHMKPEIAKNILKNAKDAKQPICIFEISDNSVPMLFAWIAIPIGFIMTLFITPFVKPMTWQQIFNVYQEYST